MTIYQWDVAGMRLIALFVLMQPACSEGLDIEPTKCAYSDEGVVSQITKGGGIPIKWSVLCCPPISG
jgi:hypothetical protein